MISINYEINRLIQFALEKKMITEDEMDYSVIKGFY